LSDNIPAFHDDLNAVCDHALKLLVTAVSNRRAPMHTPTAATLGLDGAPRCRTIVLRHFDPDETSVRFHTDIRSSKFVELQNDPRIALHFYDAAEKIQLRLEGSAELHCSDHLADEAWHAAQPMSRLVYASMPGPGSVIPTGGAFSIPTGFDSGDEGRPHFCVVRVIVSKMEWLWLGSDGHRRACFEWHSGVKVPKSEWLVP